MNDICLLCHKKFTLPKNLKNHMIKIHKTSIESLTYDENKYKCLDCGNSYNINHDLIYHLETTHGVPIEREELTFKNHNDFIRWKRNIEISESCNYIMLDDKTKTGEKSGIIKYICNQNGPFFEFDSEKKSWTCISHVKTIEDPNGDLYVARVKTHYGHDLEEKESEVSNGSESMDEVNSEDGFLDEYQNKVKEDIRMKLDAILCTLHKFENKQLLKLDNVLNGICEELDLTTKNTDIIGSIIISSNSNLDHSYI
ncbi:uncharacterized protein LOC130448457 [Diorhabda sublineata]|uniref:uncharacterized protein LOC130448457 n=1 Tax=Diorhabda sublineata TaxID=1163346 RepID=UPI0024E16C27|nr:uncharacterized protein LOC130448457 [Diorhabda sublineata]